MSKDLLRIPYMHATILMWSSMPNFVCCKNSQ